MKNCKINWCQADSDTATFSFLNLWAFGLSENIFFNDFLRRRRNLTVLSCRRRHIPSRNLLKSLYFEVFIYI